MSPAELEIHLAFASMEPSIPSKIEYRVYHDSQGTITSCSMQDHAVGDYLVVTETQYHRYFEYLVLDQRLIKIDQDAGFRVQLFRTRQGISVARGHAGLLIEPQDNYTDIEYYDHKPNS
jgi:hypothetical protein